jgi:5'-3' exonuclease
MTPTSAFVIQRCTLWMEVPRAEASSSVLLMAERELLLLLDSASLYFRAFFGVPESTVAPDGTPVNAVRGFLDFIARLVTDHRPTHLVACWDEDWRPAFRVEVIPSYKAHRVVEVTATGSVDVEEVPDTLTPQVPIIVEVLAALGIARVGSAGYEADDVIGTLCATAASPVAAVTGDRDLFQVVDDARDVRVLYTAAKGVANAEVVTEVVVAAKYGIPGRSYADFAVLRGDPSDGLPGVKGVGDKTAAALITAYGSLDEVIAAAAAGDAGIKPGVRARILESSAYLAVAPGVVAVATDCPLPRFDARLPTAPADPEALVALADRWNLGSSINRVLVALAR